MIFIYIPEFDKDIKRLLKKYKSIEDDLTSIKSILEILPKAQPPFSYLIDNLGITVPIIKIKKNSIKVFSWERSLFWIKINLWLFVSGTNNHFFRTLP